MKVSREGESTCMFVCVGGGGGEREVKMCLIHATFTCTCIN